MTPVVYDFAINEKGTSVRLQVIQEAGLPAGYYGMMVPHWLRVRTAQAEHASAGGAEAFGRQREREELRRTMERLFEQMLPSADEGPSKGRTCRHSLASMGLIDSSASAFRPTSQWAGRACRRTAWRPDTIITDVSDDDVVIVGQKPDEYLPGFDESRLEDGKVAVLSLAAGAGSRWTQGAGVCKECTVLPFRRGDRPDAGRPSRRRVDRLHRLAQRRPAASTSKRRTRRSAKQHHVKRVIAEMGGKNAVIVDADADLDEAVKGVVESAFGYQGQKCSAGSRAIVLEPLYDQFLARLIEATKSLTVAPAESPGCSVGPVIDAEARDRIVRDDRNRARREAQARPRRRPRRFWRRRLLRRPAHLRGRAARRDDRPGRDLRPGARRHQSRAIWSMP